MQEQAAAIRTDRSYDISFRRGDVELDPQEMRVEALGRGAKFLSEAAREARAACCIFGAMDLDVALDDRFTLDNVLYRVVFVSLNRDVDTQAEAVAVE